MHHFHLQLELLFEMHKVLSNLLNAVDLLLKRTCEIYQLETPKQNMLKSVKYVAEQ